MAWLKSLGRCIVCGRPATVILMNTYNDGMGLYCDRDGETAKKRLEATERYVPDSR
jgi:hypothetical protein